MSLSSSFAGSKKRPHLLSVLSSDPSPPVCFARSSLATGLDLAAFTPCSPTKKKAKTKSRRTVRFASTTKSTLSADSEPPHCVFHECSNYHPEMTEEDRLRVRNSIWYTQEEFEDFFLDRMRSLQFRSSLGKENLFDHSYCLRGLEMYQAPALLEELIFERQFYQAVVSIEQVRQQQGRGPTSVDTKTAAPPDRNSKLSTIVSQKSNSNKNLKKKSTPTVIYDPMRIYNKVGYNSFLSLQRAQMLAALDAYDAASYQMETITATPLQSSSKTVSR